MLRHYWILLFTFCFLTSCVQHRSVAPAHPVHKTHKMSAFSRVHVQGNINVNLHTGYAHPEVIVHGDPRDLAYLVIKTTGHTLNVVLGNGYPRFGPVTLDIRGHHLNAFTYKGNGTIKGTKLNTNLLDLDINNGGSTILGGHIGLRQLTIKSSGMTRISGLKSHHVKFNVTGKGRVQLTGMVTLSDIHLSKQSWLSLYWVKSDTLRVEAKDNAYIQLAGVVNKLHVKLCDKAFFNGRFLRAKRAFVKTYNQSTAEISSVDRQHTLASDNSNIYFYNIPVMKTDFMAFNGSVLDMRDLRLPFVQEYDEYNK